MPQFKTTVNLPPAFEQEIGRLIVRHAELENRIAASINDLLGIGQKKGRLAIPKASRLDRALDTLLELAKLEGRDVPLDMSAFRRVLSDLSDIRNAIAHGRWLLVTGDPAPSLQIVRNADMPQSRLRPGQWRATNDDFQEINRRYDTALTNFESVRAYALGAIPDLGPTGTFASTITAEMSNFLPFHRLSLLREAGE